MSIQPCQTSSSIGTSYPIEWTNTKTGEKIHSTITQIAKRKIVYSGIQSAEEEMHIAKGGTYQIDFHSDDYIKIESIFMDGLKLILKDNNFEIPRDALVTKKFCTFKVITPTAGYESGPFKLWYVPDKKRKLEPNNAISSIVSPKKQKKSLDFNVQPITPPTPPSSSTSSTPSSTASTDLSITSNSVPNLLSTKASTIFDSSLSSSNQFSPDQPSEPMGFFIDLTKNEKSRKLFMRILQHPELSRKLLNENSETKEVIKQILDNEEQTQEIVHQVDRLDPKTREFVTTWVNTL